jgi:uncharacterized OB-fold protein
MAKMEPILKIWYDSLNEGKIRGLKCTECGDVQFPPVPVCKKCAGMKTEWVDMDGEGELVSVSYSPMGVAPYTDEPAVSGYVRLKEGMLYVAVLLDVDEEKQQELIERLKNKERVGVRLEVSKMAEEVSFPCLRLVD